VVQRAPGTVVEYPREMSDLQCLQVFLVPHGLLRSTESHPAVARKWHASGTRTYIESWASSLVSAKADRQASETWHFGTAVLAGGSVCASRMLDNAHLTASLLGRPGTSRAIRQWNDGDPLVLAKIEKLRVG